MDWQSGVFPHDPLVELAPGLWSATGPVPGLALKRSMVVGRLPDGRLVLHSVMAMDDASMTRLDALGEVAFLIAPGPGHRIDIGRYHARYPKAKVLAPAASRKKIEEVCPVDASCEDALRGLLPVQAIPGMPAELAYEFPVDGGRALVLNDILGGGSPPEPGFTGWLFSLLGTPGGKLGVPRIVRFVQVKALADARAWVRAQAGRDDLRAVTVSHGPAVVTAVADALRAAAEV